MIGLVDKKGSTIRIGSRVARPGSRALGTVVELLDADSDDPVVGVAWDAYRLGNEWVALDDIVSAEI